MRLFHASLRVFAGWSSARSHTRCLPARRCAVASGRPEADIGTPKNINSTFGTFQASRLDSYIAAYIYIPLGALMRRREFIGLLGTAALSLSRPGHAQTRTDLPVIGFLLPAKLDTAAAKERISALARAWRKEGSSRGRTILLKCGLREATSIAWLRSRGN
jgi:hypothetical protein